MAEGDINVTARDPKSPRDFHERARRVDARSVTEVIDGALPGTEVPLERPVSRVVAVQAVVAAGGAPATKFLLDETVDYVVGADRLAMVSDQSGNRLIVLYESERE